MKKDTMQKRAKIANDLMNYIYKYIDTDINIDELSHDLKVSKFHLHRIFKDEFGKNIYETIKDIRLLKASNLLISNKNSTITEISKMTGYSSQTSFLRAFKQRFNMTPKQWKKDGYKTYSNDILKDSSSAINSKANFEDLKVEIVKMSEMKAYYIRHQGYDKSISSSWQKLQTWIYSNEISEFTQIGLHHDNPIITNLKECQYVACMKTEQVVKNSSLPTLTIPKGVYAKFSVSGVYGDVLKLIQWVYHKWLINSGYETSTNPSYTIYHKNHFLSNDGEFILDYYVPISFV
ncbi:transcription regulator [Malaciobacter pacificus]|nr:AraC family transcriptional regulator [Malaciobacter pacificus]GGD42313.1 transcription regulator [Malaciobacter pacificus]